MTTQDGWRRRDGVPRPSAVIAPIVDRYLEEAAFLWSQRERASSAPNWGLADLADIDERLAAHLDGLRVAADYGWKIVERSLDSGPGELFAGGVLALDSADHRRTIRVAREAVKSEAARLALASAFRWVSPRHLHGIEQSLLRSASATGRHLAVTAVAVHGPALGNTLEPLLQDTDSDVRATAVRACGELGLTGYGPAIMGMLQDDEHVARQAAWSAVMLGHRGHALEALLTAGLDKGSDRLNAFRLALLAMNLAASHEVLRRFARDGNQARWLLLGSGLAGEPGYIPWLISRMRDDRMARVAGEAFSLITGTDVPALHLERPRPENFESGPNDDPEDENVDMDPDEGLPWPDPDKVEKWWAANAHRFQKGTRYFMGAPVTREHCIHVLKNGYQRQRILAAHYLCLLEPGTPLFNTSAPAWRQQRLLARM
jgi:uncharacterized protein (TIGR02270 family)